MKLSILVFILLFFVLTSLKSQIIQSAVNHLDLFESSDSSFSFIACGHLYGGQSQHSIFSAPAFIANIDSINKMDFEFMFLMGDMLYYSDTMRVRNFIKSVANKINKPIFNLCGNHDVAYNLRDTYESYFGKTFYDFNYKNSKFILLDGDYGKQFSITGKQLSFFKKSLEEAKIDNQIKNVFILSHYMFWFYNLNPDKFLDLYKLRSHISLKNFVDSIKPLVLDIAKYKKTFWFSGDADLFLYYDEDTINNVTYINNALNNDLYDAMLKVIVTMNGDVSFKTISLTGSTLDPIEHYNADYWKNYINNRSLLYKKSPVQQLQQPTIHDKIFSMIIHKYFLIGIFVGIILIFIMFIVAKKIKI